MKATPPPTAPTSDLVEVLHGTAVPDPFRPLEDTDAPKTAAWVQAQNARTDAWLAQVPQRQAVHDRLTELWDHPRVGLPTHRAGRWFSLRNSGLQDQDVLVVADDPDGEGRVLVDPNTLSDQGTIALMATAASRDGERLAYATSSAGSDWLTWRVRDVATGHEHDDQVRWSKFTVAAWLPDGSGFLYGAYDPPPDGEGLEEVNQGHQLRFHRLGTSQADDVLVHATPEAPQRLFQPTVTDDGRWLVVHVREGTDRRSRVWAADLEGLADTADLVLQPVLDDFDAAYEVVGSQGDTLYVLTDHDAPRRRVVAVRVGAADVGDWREIVPQGSDVIEFADHVGEHLLLGVLHHASHRLLLHAADGEPAGEIPLPGLGTVTGVTGREGERIVHVAFTSFTRPTEVHRHDLEAKTTNLAFAPDVGLDPDAFVTTQAFVTSSDGARVPVFLTHHRDLASSGDVPTLLWGYGGFGISVTPMFKPEWQVFCEHGGMLAVPNLRGGGEYGWEWHDGGREARKQQVFDDCLAVADWLVADGWTTPERLALSGRSNGGLLAGACLTQRPEAFGAVVPEVGVLDMLRFHTFTIGWAWTTDYGSPDDAEAFRWLHAYSPLHRIEHGRAYPPVLVTTGDHDDRVVPAHSFKFTAALQAAQGGDAPILARVQTNAGHGLGKPTSVLIAERADVIAFLLGALGVDA